MRRTCGSGDLGSKKTGLLLLSRREVRSISGSDALSEQQHAPMRTAICSAAVCSVRLERHGDVAVFCWGFPKAVLWPLEQRPQLTNYTKPF